MKSSHRFFLLSLFLALAWSAPAAAQSTDTSGDDTAPPNSTVITSDELRSDQVSHIAVFTGNVVVVGTNFNMKCDEMTVYFTNDSKVDHIVSTGNVVITQPDRITHSGRAEYFRVEDKFILTDQPTILDHKNQIWAPIIIIYRTKQTMSTQGGPSRTVLIQDSFNSDAPATPTNTN